MNCFEARQDFVGFWQGALGDEHRQNLLAHLKGCPKCDRGFRAFALTAPMLHGQSGATAQSAPGATPGGSTLDVSRLDLPGNIGASRRADANRAAEILHRASVYRLADRRPSHRLRDAAAGFSAMAAAALLLYFSLATPSQSFDDLIAPSDSISETASQPDTDFLGQQMAPISPVSYDIAG
jgi:hypothetical protein